MSKKKDTGFIVMLYKQQVTFSSSKKSIASVNKKTGVIKAKKYGYTTDNSKSKC